MRLLIVDDEHYIVNYLATIIEEHLISDSNSELEIYKCYSGFEALKLLESVQMNIILMDIHMPGISGLDTAAKINDFHPDSRIIFLTAYDNFEHIYQSNKLVHTHYLLKTESDEIILETIRHIINEINEEANQLMLLSEAQQKALLLSHLIQQSILKGLFSGQKAEQLKTALHIAGSEFTLDLQQPVYLMYTQIHYKTLIERNASDPSRTMQYLQIVRKLIGKKYSFSMLDMGNGTMLWFFQPVASFSSEFEFLKTIANDFCDYCTSTLHNYTTTILYPTLSSWDDVCRHYYIMQQYADSSISAVPLIYSSVSILDSNPSHSLPSISDVPTDRADLEHALQELSFYLYQGSEKEYLTILKKLREDCLTIRSMHDIRAIKIYSSIALMLLNYIDLYNLQEKVMSKIAIYPLYYTQDFSSWEKAFQYLGTLSVHIFDILNSKKLDKNEQLINTIKRYIDEHISESLNLTSLSRLVNYNETYVSRLFKQLTGLGLSEYITLERIKKAKHLLVTTEESIQNIASTVGFDTAQYFSIVFKKTTGMSPSTYRRSHL